MKIFFLLILILIYNNNFSQELEDNNSTVYLNTAFNVGEILTYEVKYGIIKGGEATMGVELFPSGNSFVYHSKAIAYTTGVANKISTFYDIYESFFDIQTGYPIKSIRSIRENNYKKYDEVLFYQKLNYVISLNKGKQEIPDNTLDILSSFYYARRFLFDKKIEKNQTINLTTYFDEQVFPFKIKYLETETINTDFGKLECLKFVTLIEIDSPFKNEDDLQIWFTNDGNFIPVKIRVDAPIGNLKCDLIKYENIKNPLGKK